MAKHTEKFRAKVRSYETKGATVVRSAEGSAIGQSVSGAEAAKQMAVKSARRTGLYGPTQS